MYNFIKIQFALGKIDKEKVFSFVPFFITEEQAKEIVGEVK